MLYFGDKDKHYSIITTETELLYVA